MSEQPTDLKPFLIKITDGQVLTMDEASQALDLIMSGNATPAQVAALFTALRMRGETVDEIAGFARTMRKHALKVTLRDDDRPVVDTCGTGGDASGTFNISTTAAFVVASCGIRVAKHGNRSMTSRCGSADVLEALGLKIDLSPEQVAECIDTAGFGFMFAQAFHPSMKYVGPVRREIGIRTIFNVLGPLTNPAGARRQLIGVSDGRLSASLAQVLALLDADRCLLVTAHSGLDEIDVSGPTSVVEFDRLTQSTRNYHIHPVELGLDISAREHLLGGSAEQNAEIARAVLSGEGGARRTVTLINAGAAIYAAGKADSIRDGITLAADAIDSGRAKQTLQHAVDVSNSFAA